MYKTAARKIRTSAKDRASILALKRLEDLSPEELSRLEAKGLYRAGYGLTVEAYNAVAGS